MEVSTGFWKKLVCSESTPSPRSGHSAVTFNSCMYIFGGHDGKDVLNDHFSLSLTSLKWSQLSEISKLPNIPSARTSHSSAVDELTGFVYIFGGSGKDFGSSNKRDMFLFNIQENLWEIVRMQGSIPSARYGHSLTLYQSCLYLFGGTSGTEYFNDFYLFELETKSWVQLNIKLSPPINRYKHSAKVVNDKLVIIGGTNYKTTLHDAWKIDLQTFESVQIEIKKSEIEGKFTQAAEVFNNNVYVLGSGSEIYKEKASLWQLDLNNAHWKEIKQFGQRPTIVGFFTMAIQDGYCIVFGGNNEGKRLNDTFVYKLEIVIKDRLKTFESLYGNFEKSQINNVEVVTTQGSLFINKDVLNIRSPILSQHVQSLPYGYKLILDYPKPAVLALFEYILCDKVNGLLSTSYLLNLLSISAIYWIPALLSKVGNILSRKITELTVKEIVNYISDNSENRLFHRRELEENMKSYSQSSTMNQMIAKHITETFDMSTGEKIYWLCIEAISQFDSKTGLKGSVIQDLGQVKSKNGGKNVPKKTNIREISSDLIWDLRLFYETEKDFTVHCSNGSIRVHKIILISNSQYFEQLILSGDTSECVMECPLSDFSILSQYFYFGLTSIKTEDTQRLAELVPLADFLQLNNKDLHDLVGISISEDLSLENAFDTLKMALRLKSTIMLQVVYEYFIENYSTLVHRPEMNYLPVQVLVDLHRWRAFNSNAYGDF